MGNKETKTANEPKKMFCPYCGQPRGDESNFCDYCGKQLNDANNIVININESTQSPHKSKNRGFSITGLVLAVVATVFLVVTCILTFEVDLKDYASISLDSLGRDIDQYYIWFIALGIGGLLTVLSVAFLIPTIVKKQFNVCFIVMSVFLIASLSIFTFQLTQLSKKIRTFDEIQLVYDRYQNYEANKYTYGQGHVSVYIKPQNNQAINEVIAAIESENEDE